MTLGARVLSPAELDFAALLLSALRGGMFDRLGYFDVRVVLLKQLWVVLLVVLEALQGRGVTCLGTFERLRDAPEVTWQRGSEVVKGVSDCLEPS